MVHKCQTELTQKKKTAKLHEKTLKPESVFKYSMPMSDVDSAQRYLKCTS